MSPLIRILAYTAGFAGIGYGLMNIVTPDESKIVKTLPEGQDQYKSDALKKRQAIVDVLRGAAEGRDPMYRQSQAEIDAHKEKYISGKKTT